MTEKPPTVSVIIPTFNRAHLLGRAIQSVLDQTYRDFELIIVDDASTDNTREVLKSFKDERIIYIKHDKNWGAAVARNIGIREARGEYIAFQDSDDEWLPEKLEKQIKVFESALPAVGVVYTDMLRIDENGVTKYWRSPSITDGSLINPKTSNYQVINLGILSTLIRKECFKNAGCFDEKFSRLIDLELFIRLSKHYCFSHIEEPLVKYYATKGISSNINALIKAQELLFEKYSEEIRGHRKFCAKQYSMIGIALCSSGQLGKGRKYLIKAVLLYPRNIKYLKIILKSLLGQRAYNWITIKYHKIRGWLLKTQ